MRDLLITGARVFDLDGDVAQPPLADLLIRDGRIAAVGPDAAAQAPTGTSRLDATGKLLIPGLVNAHYHSHDVLLRGLFEQMPLDVWGLYSAPTNFAHRPADEVYLRTLLGAAENLVRGVTTMQDMVTVADADRAHVAQILHAYDTAGVRISLGLQISDRAPAETVPYWDEIGGDWGARLGHGTDTEALRALIEALLDEDAPESLTWALAPSAPQRCSDDLLTWVAALSKARDLQVFTHLYEARNQTVLARQRYPGGSLLGHLDRFGLVGPRLTIAHGVWITDDELARFGAAGAAFVNNPASNLKLLNGFAPLRRYAEAGATVAVGCDNCSGNDAQNVWESMKLFALFWGMQSAAGETGAARAAFHAATLGGARALGMDGEIGALRPGYRGDVVVIDLATAPYRPLNNALNQLVYAETGASVREVIVGGRIVARDGALNAQSDATLKAAAEAARDRLAPEIEAVAARNAEIVPLLLDAYTRADGAALELDRYRIDRPQPWPCACGGGDHV